MKALTTPPTISPPPRPAFVEWLGLQTFDDPALRKLAQAAQDWWDAMKRNETPRWLTMLGVSGTGKTHCAKRLWQLGQRRFDWHQIAYIQQIIRWPDLINDLRQGNGYGLRDNLRSWPLLCLDELGGERDLNGFSAENLCTVLAGRENKWTIITSNKEFAELHKLDARISSRLVRGQNICVEVKTQDYWTRPEVNAQKPK